MELAGKDDSGHFFPGGPAHMMPCVCVISFICKAGLRNPNLCENKLYRTYYT